MRIVAIVPTLDEEASIERCLAPLLAEADAVIVVDGGSADATRERASRAGAEVVTGPRGRASQMNEGAGRAAGADVLIFVHADTGLPARWRDAVTGALASGRAWGRFDVALDDDGALLAVVAAMMNLRSRASGVCTGDQAIFVARAAWDAIGGFPSQPLMEDIELSRRLRRAAGRPAAVRVKALASARRWRKHGTWRTIALMTLLRSLYALGVSPATLHRMYYGRGAGQQ